MASRKRLSPRIPAGSDHRGHWRRAAATLSLLLAVLARSNADDDERTRRLGILNYGIESQVIELVTALGTEKNDEFATELLVVLDDASSPKLRSAVLSYFGKRESKAAEGIAARFIERRDELDPSLVDAAFAYLAGIRSSKAVDSAEEILADGEKRFMRSAVILLGRSGGDSHVETLTKAYESDDTEAAVKEQIVLALGSMKASSSYDFLKGLAASDESTKVIRMGACAALGELGDERAIPTLVTASVASDPNVRTSALAALGKFASEEAKKAVREGLRDSHVLARAAAAKAAGESLDKKAKPFLEFKIRNDPERYVREASIEALSKIGGDDAEAFIAEFAEDQKATVQYRAYAFDALLRRGGDASRSRMLELLKSAQPAKDRNLYLALARAVVSADIEPSTPFVLVLLGDTDHATRLGGIAWAERNKSKSLEGKLREMSESDPVEAVRKRASQALVKVGA